MAGDRGQNVPYFDIEMIAKEKITEMVSGNLGEGLFLVDVTVGADNDILVEIDSSDGLSIDQCVAVSRYLESHLDRDQEDYALKVSSPGLGQPFKVREQYRKNIGREVELTTLDQRKITGRLTAVDEDAVEMEVELKQKTEGAKRSRLVPGKLRVDFQNIRKACVVISFK